MSYSGAVWLAVSSKPQYKTRNTETGQEEEKDSLPNQERICLSTITDKGWNYTGLTYTVPGQSRTKYVELSAAVRDMPALREMLDDAQKGRFNLLVMYDFSRLRDLLQQVAKKLESYGVQIYSVNQPVNPQPPDKFSRYTSDSSAIMRGISGILSDAQIADLQRKYRSGNTSRTEKGLHSLNVPWGYRVVSKKLPAEQVPEQVAIILRIKQLFWDGLNYTEITRLLNTEGIPSPKGKQWGHSVIRGLLKEEYYAKKVYFGRTKATRDYDLNRYNIRANPDVEFREGKHVPLWTWEEHLAIVAEIERRNHKPRTDTLFAGLLWCSVCGERLFLSANHYKGYVCKKYCTGLKNFEVIEVVSKALQKALRDTVPGRLEKSENVLSNELEQLKTQRQRIQHLYKIGSPIYTQEEAEREILKLDSQIKAYQTDEASQELRKVRRESYNKLLAEWRKQLDDLPDLIELSNPREMNRILRQLVKKITVTQDARHREKADNPVLVVEMWE